MANSAGLRSTSEADLDVFERDELKLELVARGLNSQGNKSELLKKVLADNIRNSHVNEITAENERLKQEMELLRTQFESLSTTPLVETQTPQNIIIASPDSTTSVAQVHPDLVGIIAQLAQTQQLLAANMQQPIQLHSTMDTAKAIPKFSGDVLDSVKQWTDEVDRVATHANWNSSLKLLNAITRLSGKAADWHKVHGRKLQTYDIWKTTLHERFKRKMTMKEFIDHQATRILRDEETLVEYIYAKDAILERSPHTLTTDERISMIIGDIGNDTWANPLLSQNFESVENLIDRAANLDLRRRTVKSKRTLVSDANPKHEASKSYSQQVPTKSSSPSQSSTSKFYHKYNPRNGDKPTDQHCWRCGQFGHVSNQCSLPPPDSSTRPRIARPAPAQLPDSEQPAAPAPSTINRSNSRPPVSSKQNVIDSKRHNVNCVSRSSSQLTLIPAVVHGTITLDALCDPGSTLTLMRRCFAPPAIDVHDWQDGPLQIAGGYTLPVGWISLRIQVGSIDYLMPKVCLVDQLPVALILGTDWLTSVQARYVLEPDGDLCLQTPFATQAFKCISTCPPSVNCVQHSPLSVAAIADKLESHLTSDQVQQLQELQNDYADIFALDANDVGICPHVELEINLFHDRPIQCRPYRQSEPDRQFLNDQVKQWIDIGICRPSTSQYAAPAFIVEQPFHESTPRRVVIDYSRTINPITVPDPHPIDNMDDVIRHISGKRFKSKMDVKKAFHTMTVKPDDISKTAFVTMDGHYEFVRVPFGVCNGPATLARAVKKGYEHLRKENVNTYYDDVTTAHDDFSEHLHSLRGIFEATRFMGFKFDATKCVFAALTLALFGCIIALDGISPDPDRTAAVTRYDSLHSIHETRSFLGFANTFRKYIKNYASIVKPLTDRLKGISRKPSSTDDSPDFRRRTTKIMLTPSEQTAFERIKTLITSPPVLGNFSHGQPTYVETDASYSGLGACLSQVHNGERKIIEYASRALKDTETRYHSNELECTAVHWAITEKFRLYLLGQPFTLITDNFTTAYIIAKAKINRKFARHIVDLASFVFTTEHRPGKHNLIADHLSRYPDPPQLQSSQCLAIIRSADSRLVSAQAGDEYCKNIIAKLEHDPNTPHLLQIRESFAIENDVLIHKKTEHGSTSTSIVVPQSLRSSVMKLCHDDAGHMDVEKTLTRVRSRYWWPKARQDTAAFVRGCPECQHVNRRTTLASGLLQPRPIPETPWEIVSADHIVCLPPSTAGNTNLLVHIDHATRYVTARASASLASYAVTDSIAHDIIYRYGPPTMYISDQGPAFTARHTQRFLKKFGIEHAPAPPYTPQSNGLVERANSVIVAVLKKVIGDDPATWDVHLPNTLLAINTARQSSTNFSPFYLLHGYHPRLPNELLLGTVTDERDRECQLDLLLLARQAAHANLRETHEENARRFNTSRLDRVFNIGDLVLRTWPQSSDHKLTPAFKGPYRILRRVGAVCYQIAHVDSAQDHPAEIKIVHVQSLKPFKSRPNLDMAPELNDADSDDLSTEPLNLTDPENDDIALEIENQPQHPDPAPNVQPVNSGMTRQPEQSTRRSQSKRTIRPPLRFKDFDMSSD